MYLSILIYFKILFIGRVPANYDDDELRNMPLGSFLKHMFKQFFKTLLNLMKNPVYIFLNLAGSAETLIISGVGAFSFKFLLEQYQMDFETVGFLIGKTCASIFN